jgi:hypothetical protein
MKGRSVVLRMYDKGAETGQAGPGEWLRLERQRRYRKDRERTAAQVLSDGLYGAFVGRELSAVVEAGTAVTVCDPLDACAVIADAQARGKVSARLARSLAGFVLLGPKGMPARTVRHQSGVLRRLGIALDVNAGGRSSVALGAYLQDFTEAWAA